MQAMAWPQKVIGGVSAKLPGVADVLSECPRYRHDAVVIDIGLGFVFKEKQQQAEDDGDDDKKLQGNPQFAAFLAHGVVEQPERLHVARDAEKAHHAHQPEHPQDSKRQREQQAEVERVGRHHVDEPVE